MEILCNLRALERVCWLFIGTKFNKQKHMNRNGLALTLAATTAALAGIPSAQAEPLNRSQISADAKWVIHLDVDAFRKTKVGAKVLELANTKYRAALKDAGLNFNTDFDKLANITAYGPEFREHDPEGVLIVKSRSDLKTDLDALIGLAALSGDESKKIVKSSEDSVETYSVGNDMHGSLVASDTLVLAKPRGSWPQAGMRSPARRTRWPQAKPSRTFRPRKLAFSLSAWPRGSARTSRPRRKF